ncbi:MAG: glycerol-3-phosphate 1-O-acyltransferase PlsY [Phycisphaerales bacterium]|jgi:glycerol-3-phosphate acyltransferase PlsY|nr:glycerol-3-phosphate 1-O-acyltransferase PlsY [Phycisphaerales bacterium]
MTEAALHFGWYWWIWSAIAFVSGSVPFGVIIARRKGVDIRQSGSGNPGSTNVGRVLGKRFGILCFILDALKGAAPVLLSGWLGGVLGMESPANAAAWGWLLVAVCAILGHCFSPWLGFRGGKGVATGFGAVLAMWPVLTVPALAAFAVWGITLGLTRFMSLASMAGAIVLPSTVVAMALGGEGGSLKSSLPFLVITGAIAAFVVFRHRNNLIRLRVGAEPRVGREDAPDG